VDILSALVQEQKDQRWVCHDHGLVSKQHWMDLSGHGPVVAHSMKVICRMGSVPIVVWMRGMVCLRLGTLMSCHPWESDSILNLKFVWC